MTEMIAAGLMWALTVALAATLRPKKDPSILVAAGFIALATTLNIDSVYVTVDSIVGGHNLFDLIANGCLMVGIYFLSEAIVRAARPQGSRSGRGYGKWGRYALSITLTVTAVSFASIRAPQTSTTFMLSYGTQPGAFVYSVAQYLYIGAVMAHAGWTCLRFRGSWHSSLYRTSFALIEAGCALALVTALAVFTMDIFHMSGNSSALRVVSAIYDPAYVVAIALLCTGLGLPPVIRAWKTKLVNARAAGLIRELQPTWRIAIANYPQLHLDKTGGNENRRTGETLRGELHRMVVETHDCLAFDPSLNERIGEDGLRPLHAASLLLESSRSAGS
ncbi:hypothetical protein KIH31_15415 [Paenarthrobacter sp. DKR-5]|uniref:MAB_1171c family putative transporter n=1 Tax=Paenarthrobacter sp. DKR-5 TaxID=2835535 RepID=UPI001BDC5376|nr:MAB_1171c family putative transporter [Paenarthrobacter sp. DKR-5]MBT1003977.1 hypothetical protein [Paenarthrobacter sp. DKR-5]